jgi:hypothetical protein
MDEQAIQRAKERVAEAAEQRPRGAELEAALERARQGLEELAVATADLPDQVSAAVRDGVAAEARPVARQLAEVRGLMNQVIRRLERIEGDALTERHARVDDLALVVDLIASGWQSVDERLARLEQHLQSPGAVVYRMEERRPATG